MVRVQSSRGGMVNVEIKGVAETIRMLQIKNLFIEGKVDAKTLQAANFVQQEVQESIVGRRLEKKSVDTGRFGNSITVKKQAKASYVVHPRKEFYPGTSTNTQEVATLLEFGTRGRPGRRHFRNTEARVKKKVRDIIKKGVKEVRL